MEKISKILADYVIHKGMVNEEDRSMYEYGFIITMEVALFAIFCLIMTLHLHMFIEGILFFVIFVPLRSYTGGLHLEKYYSCLILSCITFSGILIVVKHIQMPMWVSVVVLFVLTIFVYMLYPVENINRKVDREENQYFKTKLKRFLFMDMLIAVLCIILKSDSELFLMATVFTVVVITMLIGKYKNKNIYLTSE